MMGKHPRPMLLVSMLAAILSTVFVGGLMHQSWDGHASNENDFGHGESLHASGPPTTADPPNQVVLLNQPGVTIQWTIIDDDDTSGLYVILVDQALDVNSLEAIMVSQTLHTWTNNTLINYSVATSVAGNHNYTIFFTDMTVPEIIAAAYGGLPISGNASTVWVYIERPPVVDFIGRTRFHVGEVGQSLTIAINDQDTPSGIINVTVNGTHVIGPNGAWTNPAVFNVPINTTAPAIYDFFVSVSDQNYTITETKQVQVAHSFPPEITGIENRTISVDDDFIEYVMIITDMENTTGNYTILRGGNPFNASYVNATWSNATSIQIYLEIQSTGFTTFQAIAQDLDGNQTTTTFHVYANTPPVISIPANITITLSTRNQNISWVISDVDDQNGTYTVFRNGSVYLVTYQDRPWMNGTAINVPIIVSATGTYIFSIQAFDGYSYRSQAIRVIVIADRDDLLSEDTKNVIFVVFIITGIAGFGIIMYKRKD
nr:hypothetical protein [Candidatus Sigynarchaeota archaeon]